MFCHQHGEHEKGVEGDDEEGNDHEDDKEEEEGNDHEDDKEEEEGTDIKCHATVLDKIEKRERGCRRKATKGMFCHQHGEHEKGVEGDDEEPPSCPICIEVVKVSGGVVRLPCGHVYHRACFVKQCVMTSSDCAICRRHVNVGPLGLSKPLVTSSNSHHKSLVSELNTYLYSYDINRMTLKQLCDESRTVQDVATRDVSEQLEIIVRKQHHLEEEMLQCWTDASAILKDLSRIHELRRRLNKPSAKPWLSESMLQRLSDLGLVVRLA